jgi:YD repeat-containing protein
MKFVGCGPITYEYQITAGCSFTMSSVEYLADGRSIFRNHDGGTVPAYGARGLTCPEMASELNGSCYCNVGYSPSADGAKCVETWESFRTNKRPDCKGVSGNPIVTALGVKRQQIDLGLKIGELPITLNYNSSPVLVPALQRFKEHVYPYWRLNIVPQIYRSTDGLLFSSVRADGSTFNFSRQNGTFVSDADMGERLVADGSNLLLFSYREGRVEKYSEDGRLLGINTLSGRLINYVYSDVLTHPDVASSPGMLIKISDDLGGAINLRYDSARRLKSLTGRSSQDVVVLDYDGGGRMSGVSFPDGTAKLLKYTNSTHPTTLTGIVFEDGISQSAYSYDAFGRATSTGMTGVAGTALTFAGAPVVSTTKTYTSTGALKVHEWNVPLSVNVTQPNGSVLSQDFGLVMGFPRIKSVNQPAGSGCLASVSGQDYDANGNLAWGEDFKGNRTCYANDQGRNLETSRVEGLASGSSCAGVLAANATLPPSARKVSATWHPVWRKQTQVAEPRRLTTYVYNGQPDPFTSQAASCADGATLPDGTAVVVLCKQVEQATTDANGSKGIDPTVVDPTVPMRVQQWTYNQYGQVLTAKDPLNNTTTNAYYSDTTADHTKGDLHTVTNAKQQKTTFTKYNSTGQWLEMKDANGVVTTRTFDLRQRLKSVSTDGVTTSYDYWPNGLLKNVTLPDASSVSYGYDGAHRLTSVTDSLGNSVTYTLDSSGNRTGEEIKDPAGRLTRTLTRVPDALNRIQQVTGRE